jgi:acylphosphatase
VEPGVADSVRFEASVRGRVQGVGFRYFVVREGRRLGLTGWVANEFDGSVRVVAEGSEPAIAQLEASLQMGPPGAIVDTVSGVRMAPTGRLDRFAVRSAGHSGD